MAVTPKQLISPQYVANALTSYYTVGASTTTRLETVTLTNHGASTETVTMHIIPSGGSADDSNQVLDPVTAKLSAGEKRDFIFNHTLIAADDVQLKVDTASTVSVIASGIEIT